MSTPQTWQDQLDDHLATDYGTAPFVVDSLDKAEWAMRAIAKRERQIAEINRTADNNIARINHWRETEIGKHTDGLDYLSGELEVFHRAELKADAKRKTIKLPSGEIRLRAARDRFDVDEPVFLAAQPDGSPLVRVKLEPNKDALKQLLTADGEVPAGVVFVKGSTLPPEFKAVPAPPVSDIDGDDPF